MLLLKRRIKWESEEHLEFMDKVFETINRAAILASSNLAKEKGSYQFFEGSDWQTGAYFDKRGYDSAEWQDVRKTVALQGMRNAYLLAVAPTSSTSIIAGTTAGLDPIMKRFFLEEKKGSMLPRVAPELQMRLTGCIRVLILSIRSGVCVLLVCVSVISTRHRV